MDASTDDGDLWRRPETVADCGEPAGQGDRVVVEEGDIAARRRLPSRVARNAETHTLLAQTADVGAILELSCDLGRTVGGAVVDDKDLVVLAGKLLVGDTRQGPRQEFGAITRANDHGDQRSAVAWDLNGLGHDAIPWRKLASARIGKNGTQPARDRATGAPRMHHALYEIPEDCRRACLRHSQRDGYEIVDQIEKIRIKLVRDFDAAIRHATRAMPSPRASGSWACRHDAAPACADK